MLYRVLAGVVLVQVLISGIARAQPTTRPTPSLPTTQPIPRQTLEKLYQRELGKLYRPEDSEKLYQAQLLLEQFFAFPEGRENIARSLEAIGLDAGVVGRLCRIRLNWPELAPGTYYINERVGPHNVRYFLGVPRGYDRTIAWPLVIKLPTAEAFVAEPKPDPTQVTQIYSAWMNQELSHHPDAVVIMPLLNLDELWGPSYAGMNSVIQPMLHVANRVNIDPAKVYMVGHSMSGHAVWNLALHYTTYFASFNVLAGGAAADWQRVRLMNLRNVLPVVWHDADDTVLKVDVARQLVKALRGLKCEVDYEETKGIGHVPSAAIADQCYAKMRSRSRELYPKEISIQSTRPDTMFNRLDWVQVYQPLRSGEEKKIFFARGSGHMLVYPAAWTVNATLDRGKNAIVVTTQNVESLRFYVNDQMIDFPRAVSVVVNRRPRFEAILKPSIDEMLKDQQFLGRGWRYFTAVIDIDLAAERPATATSRPASRP